MTAVYVVVISTFTCAVHATRAGAQADLEARVVREKGTDLTWTQQGRNAWRAIFTRQGRVEHAWVHRYTVVQP